MTDPNEETIERLGGIAFAECPQCTVRFKVRLPTHWVLVFYRGELSTREEDDLDPFCSHTCAESYMEDQRNRTVTDYDFFYSRFDG